VKTWVKKLLDQFEVDWTEGLRRGKEEELELNEERATLLFMIDTLNKHLIDLESHPIRRTREALDEFAKGLIDPKSPYGEKALFRLRQFYSTYRIDEYAYMQKTFDDFKNIIWDFADQLGEEIKAESDADQSLNTILEDLREAVESNSIDTLRSKSRLFIDQYMENQNKKERRKEQRIDSIQKNITGLKKKLTEANHLMRTDHMTGAFNRKSFEEQIKKYVTLGRLSNGNVSLLAVDIDHFKKVNDTYGHDTGDVVLKECIRMLKEVFHRPHDFVARLGGEEFSVILPDYKLEDAGVKAEEALSRIRKEALVVGEHTIKFTISIGVAQLHPTDTTETWVKRADQALYESKNTGRNKKTLAQVDTASGKIA
jgi:diguanylate cyclase